VTPVTERLPAALAGRYRIERHLVQEIKTTASLQHPHILRLFDSGTADGFLFYVMPFSKGGGDSRRRIALIQNWPELARSMGAKK
jgi:serine/threonine protein kinase